MSENPETETGVAFAAGVATAQAATAEQKASEAEFRADMAEANAEAAAGAAQEAANRADDAEWNARIAVDDLSARFDQGMAEIRELISPKANGDPPKGEPAPEPGAVPAPERKEGESAAVVGTDDGKPKRRSGYGSQSWFGN